MDVLNVKVMNDAPESIVLAEIEHCLENHVDNKLCHGTSTKVREESGIRISRSKTSFTISDSNRNTNP